MVLYGCSKSPAYDFIGRGGVTNYFIKILYDVETPKVCNIIRTSSTTKWQLPNSLPNRFSLPQHGPRELTLQLDSKEWTPHFGVLSRLQNCLNTVLEFLALNYSHQDKGLKCEVIVRWTKEPAQRTVSLQLQLQQLLQLQHLEGQPTWWGGADYYYSTLFNLILYSVLKIWFDWLID